MTRKNSNIFPSPLKTSLACAIIKQNKYILRDIFWFIFSLQWVNIKRKKINTALEVVILKMSSCAVSIESDSNGFSLCFSSGPAKYSFTCEKEHGISIKKSFGGCIVMAGSSQRRRKLFLGLRGAKLPGRTATTGLHPIAGWMSAIPDAIRRLIISFSRGGIAALASCTPGGLLSGYAAPEIWPALYLRQERV